MQVSRPYNNEIVVIHDIISEEENDILLYAARNEGLRDIQPNELEIVYKVENRIRKVIEQEYTYMTNPSYRPMYVPNNHSPFVIRGEGDFMTPHYDGAPNAPLDKQPLNVGVIYYVTDNFDGGETFYPELGVAYKPVARSAIIHPGQPKFLHQVNEIKNGTRITMVTFGFNDYEDVYFLGRESLDYDKM